jgi:pyruvate, water dikinase
MSKNILWFSEVGKDDGNVVGGKGANLGELTRAGFPVPPGFIVTADAYFTYLKETGLAEKIEKILSGLDMEDSKDLQKRATEVQTLVVATPPSQSLKKEIIEAYEKLAHDTHSEKLYVAVRSSATAEDLADASFAGQQSTYLNIEGGEDVFVNVLKCWASLFGARAIYYRADQGFDQLSVGIAVPVQKMIDAESSGVMFTIDPTNNDYNHVSIEAAYGWGEVVVLGAVTPDRYLVDKKTREITTKDIATQTWMISRDSKNTDTDDAEEIEKMGVPVPQEKQGLQKISDKNIFKLFDLAVAIEKHYGKPQDTEWAIEGGKVYMVQSRPVTTLGDSAPEQEDAPTGDISSAEVILKGAAASIGMASGNVVVIHSPKEIDKIKEGDVLVTEMTTPDFVPAMKRATAIVTDKGGRTCHAAIVSRELGIPCVVGTETATTTLKDMGVITVDGKSGLIYKGNVVPKKEEVVAGAAVAAPAKVITATKLYVISAEPELAEKHAARDIDGVGLLRAEFIIA